MRFTWKSSHRCIEARAEQRTFINEWEEGYTDQLTPAELNIIREYPSNALYWHINHVLRKEYTPDFATSEQIRHLTTAMRKSDISPLPEDVIVYRSALIPELHERFDAGTLIDDNVVDKGFISTSLDFNHAMQMRQGDDAVFFTIKLKAGQRALHPDWSSGNRPEAEILLPRGTAMRVTGAQKTDNVLHLEVEVSGDPGDTLSDLPSPLMSAAELDDWSARTLDDMTPSRAAANRLVMSDPQVPDVLDGLEPPTSEIVNAVNVVDSAQTVLPDKALVYQWIDSPELYQQILDRGGKGGRMDFELEDTDFRAVRTTSRAHSGELSSFDSPVLLKIELEPGQTVMPASVKTADLLLPRGLPLRAQSFRTDNDEFAVTVRVDTTKDFVPEPLSLPTPTAPTPVVAHDFGHSTGQMIDFLNDWRDDYTELLMPDHREAISGYANNSFDVNNLLRDNQKFTAGDATPQIALLDEAFEIADNKLSEPIVVYRGTASRRVSSELKNGTLIGSDHIDPGYTSTTLSRSKATEFLGSSLPGDDITSVLYRITLQPGQTALHPRFFGSTNEEFEVLLPRGAVMRVTGYTESDKLGGPTIVDAEMIGAQRSPVPAFRPYEAPDVDDEALGYFVPNYDDTDFNDMLDSLPFTEGSGPIPTGVIDSPAAQRDFIETWSARYDGELRDDERKALDDYSGFGFSINRPLRANEASPSGVDYAMTLDRAFARASTAPLTENVTVFRGGVLPELNDILDDDSIVGELFTDRGFVSTSLDRNAARSFIGDEDEEELFPVLFEIDLYPGQVALHPDSDTILLSRDSTFRITGRSTDDNGIVHIRAEVVDPPDALPPQPALAPSQSPLSLTELADIDDMDAQDDLLAAQVEFLDAWEDQYLGLLEPRHLDAIDSYANEPQVNDYLRKGDPLSEIGLDQLKYLDEAFVRVEGVTPNQPLVVWRGADLPNVHQMFEEGRLIDSKYVDKGYVSTSLSRADAEDFYGGKAVMYRIDLPGGQHALHPDMGGDRSEHEILLPRNTEFEVTNAYMDEADFKQLVVEMRVVPRDVPLPASPVREILDVPSADQIKFLNDWNDELDLLLKKKHLKVIDEYSNGGFTANQVLRSLRDGGDVYDNDLERLSLLDEAFELVQNKGLDDGIVVYRGANLPKVVDAFNTGDLIDSTYTDLGYLSTSLDEHIVKRFVNMEYDDAVIYRIKLPSGQHALLPDFMNDRNEREVLLPRETSFRVTDAKMQRDEIMQDDYLLVDIEPVPTPVTHVPEPEIDFREITKFEEQAEFLDTWNAKYADALTNDEQRAVDDYVFKTYREINEALRDDELPIGFTPGDPLLVKIAKLDEAMEKAAQTPLEEGIIVHRASVIPELIDLYERGQLIGSTTVDHGFMSTSLRIEHSLGFIKDKPNATVVHVLLKPGQVALHPDRPLERDRWESEILLPRGTKLRYIDAYRDDDELKTLHVTAEVVPDSDGTLMLRNDDKLSVEQMLDLDLDPERLLTPDQYKELTDATYRVMSAGRLAQDDANIAATALRTKILQRDQPDVSYRIVPKSETKNFIDEWSKQYVDDLMPDEQDAIIKYARTSYGRLNRALRGKEYGSELTVQQINAIDAAFKHAGAAPLTEPITVFRATKIDSVLKQFNDGTLIGSDHTDYGYISTTLDKKFAESFEEDITIIYELRLDPGQVALHPDISSSDNDESEVLLPRGSRLRAVSAERDAKGILRIVADVLPPDPDDSGRLRGVGVS